MNGDAVPARFQLLLQQAERMLDLQIEGIAEELRRTERLIQLGIATIGGTIAVYGLMVNAGVEIDGMAAGLFGVAVVLVCLAVLHFLGATTVLGTGRAIRFGPDVLGALAQMEEHGDATDQEHVVSFALMHVRAIQHNEQFEVALNRQRARGLLLLVFGVFAELFAVGYIRGSHIIA